MNVYQYPLFFEARELTDREKMKIWRHFQRRRDSGGGECSVIENVEENVYIVSFQESQDQERVLQRKAHTISLPGGELQLTVRQTSSPQTQGQPLAVQSEAWADPNARCLEKKFKPDVFLLYYLRDNQKAQKIFQKQLSSVGCTLEFDFEQEEAVVWGDIEEGSARAFSGIADKWELQVDLIFFRLTENYHCHYVLEPILIEKLLQDSSFVSDDIKVYTESGYAVLVGETKAVKENIAILKKFLPIQKELLVVEKKFKLVEDEFRREMSTHYPYVQVSRGATNSIILEGPIECVQSGAAKLDELMKKIKEKKVRLSIEVLNFITTSGFASKYSNLFQQNLRCPVSVEVGSDLLLSCLFSDSLYEAETAVLRDLSVVSIQLHGAAAVPPDLTRVKEMLQEAKNEANTEEIRVNFNVISSSGGTPRTKVQLVGYTEQVNKLKELLRDYQVNQVTTEEVLNLQFPEMVDHFDKILQTIGMTETKVTMKVSDVPSPCVVLSGPLRLVKETQQALTSALASLTLDTLVLDGPGPLHYFQGDGKVSKELVERSCKVLMCEQGVYSSFGTINPRRISFSISFTPRPSISRNNFNTLGERKKINLEIKICSLEKEQVNVLVAPMLNQQLASTNIGKCLLQNGGNTVQSNFESMAACYTLVPGNVLEVDASPSLGCSKIFFIESMPWDRVTGRSVQALGNGLRRCLDLCVQQGFSSVAIPVIGPGLALNYPLSEAVQVLTKTIHEFGMSSGSGSLTTIHIVIKPGYPDSECFYEVYKQLSLNMNQGSQVSAPVSLDQIILNTNIANQQSAFQFLGLSRKDVDDAMEKIKTLYEAQCSNQTFNKEDLMDLTQEDVLDLQHLVETEGLCLQLDLSGNLTVRGLKHGANKMIMLMHDLLRRKERIKEENNLYTRVAWCIMGQNGNWERLPKTANFNMEKQDIASGIQDAQGLLWQVDLQNMTATSHPLEQSILKRLEHLDDFTFPLYWDNMAPGEVMKVVELQQHSPEYMTVERGFRQTIFNNIRKIERLQNIHLYRAYEAQKKQLSDKNKHRGGEGEKLLYHGTTQDDYDSIMKTGFNTSFAGQNETAHGEGTYFAVKASDSAQTTYSRPAADGSQRMFVARVLTGSFTQGQYGMKVPPPLNNQQPNDRYDSVVDNINSPSMFIVFHDDQAYPDYLITFK